MYIYIYIDENEWAKSSIIETSENVRYISILQWKIFPTFNTSKVPSDVNTITSTVRSNIIQKILDLFK